MGSQIALVYTEVDLVLSLVKPFALLYQNPIDLAVDIEISIPNKSAQICVYCFFSKCRMKSLKN